jgi:hypothetical protein
MKVEPKHTLAVIRSGARHQRFSKPNEYTHVSIGPRSSLERGSVLLSCPIALHDSLHDPHFGAQVLASLLQHLSLLILVIHSLVDERSNSWVIIEGREELLRYVVSIMPGMTGS